MLLGKTASATAQRHILQDGSPQHQCCENLKSHIIIAVFAQGTRNLNLALCILGIKFYFFILFLFLQAAEKAVLDGTSPPVQTIIFENTNYKSTPDLTMKAKFSSHMKHQRSDKPRGE